jgi:hypothetical protein
VNVTVSENTCIEVSDSCKRNRDYRRVGNEDDGDDGAVDDDDLIHCACDSSRQQRGQWSLRYKALERRTFPLFSLFLFRFPAQITGMSRSGDFVDLDGSWAACGALYWNLEDDAT